MLRETRPDDAHDRIPFDSKAVHRGFAQLLTEARLGHAWIASPMTKRIS